MRRLAAVITALAATLIVVSSAQAASRCYTTYPMSQPFRYQLQVTITGRHNISCEQSYKVARLVWHRYTTAPYLPVQDYPPPPLGVPGGQGKPFQVKPSFGKFTCHMIERGSDFIFATCQRGNKNLTISDHRNDLP